MPRKLSEVGRKKPQIDVPIGILQLDNRNPRLAEEHQGAPELDVLRVLYEEFDLGEIAYSMAENGYFDEEPIVVIPLHLPRSFKWGEDVSKLEADFEELIAKNRNIRFTVVEGNRRIATAKLLIDKGLRDKLRIRDDDFPKVRDKGVDEDLRLIPAIIYKERRDVSPYLGVRHITGILRWEAYAKARYIAVRIQEEKDKGKTTEESIREVQRKVGDRTDVIKKQFMFYKVFEQARKDLEFDTSEIINRFSLITVALNSPSIRDFIGVPSYKDVTFNKPLVPKSKLENLEILLTWIFGNGKDKSPILTDSRKITSHLAPILADKEATEYLRTYGNIEEAYERSGGDREFVIRKITTAKRAVSNALQSAYKYKEDKEIISLLEELSEAIDELRKTVSKNDRVS